MFLTQFLARCDGYPVLCILKISANQQGNASEVFCEPQICDLIVLHNAQVAKHFVIKLCCEFED
jgi:hypothetical protein